MKSEKALWAKLKEIELDERLHYRPAAIRVNAVLALIQTDLVARANQLRWIIGIPLRNYGTESKSEIRKLNVK